MQKPKGIPPVAGIPVLKKVAAGVAAGTYLDIWGFNPPSEAYEDQIVDFSFNIQNNWSGTIWMAGTATVNGYDRPVSPEWAERVPGASATFYGSFQMPGQNVKLHVYAWYWSESGWLLDDDEEKTIRVASPKFSNLYAVYQKA